MIEGLQEPGLNQRLLLHTQLGRSDYSWADLLNSNPTWIPIRASVLFWHVYRPQSEVDDWDALDEDERLEAITRLDSFAQPALEQEFTEALGALAREYGVHPETTGGSDEWQHVVALSTSAWLSAAHALALKRLHQASNEDVLAALRRARQAGIELGLEPVHGPTRWVPEEGFFNSEWSIGGRFYSLEEFYGLKTLQAIVLLELFRATAGRIPSDDRLHLWAVALDCLNDAFAYAFEESGPERLAQGNQTDLEIELLGLYWHLTKQPPPSYTQESDLKELRFALDVDFGFGRHDYRLCQGACPDPQQVARLIGQLLADGHGAKWRLVAEDCHRLARHSGGFWNANGEVSDERGQPWQMGAYLAYAQGRAEERLSPSEMTELLRLRKDDQAEDRLKGYFFPGTLWSILPERAQRALVDADQTMLDPGQGRPESFLGDLKIATESLCWELIWQVLREKDGGDELLPFKRRLSELGRHSPTLSDYADVSTQPVQRILASSWNVTPIEVRAIVEQLRRLSLARNPAQHEPGFKANLEEARKIYNAFIGIGGQGVLPTLARIRQQLSEQASLRLSPQPELRLLPNHDQP